MSGLQHAERLWNNILALGGRRIAALSLIGVVVFLAVGLGAYYLSRPAQEPLYTGLSREDVGRIGSVLKDANIPFDVSADGAAVLVAYGHTAQARMLLAEKGLPQSAKSGYELFNDLGSLGMTSFMQEVTRVRALEGEIARTIQGMKGVKAARVHIVLPDRGSFRRDQQPPSASVVVRTEPADDVSGAQSIRHLVASAVPGMKPDRVTVIGSDGSLLLSGDDANAVPTGKMATLEKTIGHEVQDNIRRTLTPYLGVGNFEVSVAARLNTDKTVQNETIFNPDQRVERSTRAVRETENSQNRNAGQRPTTAQANLPDQRARSDGGDTASNETQKREDLTNYEISSKTIQTVSDGYNIKHISVAVLVNRARLAALAGPDASKAAIDAQVAEIEQLVGSAAGFNKERGDNVKVAAVGFVNDGQPLEPVAPLSLTDVLMRQSATLINAGTILLVAGLLIWFGLRPAMRAILEIPAAQQEEARALAAAAEAQALAAAAPNAALAGPNAALGADPDAVASLAAPGQSPVASMIEDLTEKLNRSPQKRLEQMIEADEAQAAEILKRWLLREAA
ncbi:MULTISPECIES: flagellar basal-body MS-ring/collar protein FliF [unclassified Methylobacterium]|uniref:flagellar basal-body MS-ring/collar protein FliF n=1 Tax=unclassified Methylobacterium TaxID=2615210 RepID=UPI0006F69135|nr:MULTISPECIES: flagellar basal-body MS-ring/collar protein FliF [unclassified Methylobacterium]KQO63957.1 flagellar M-ring protein FliF [Methylobacterium sp. Leaf88]KQO72750.1 flagellar M-ring protein FliF [Methylobacterium sp. Leaf89]